MKYYRNNILPDNPESEQWDWQYFLLENAVFASAFIPLVTSSGNSFGSGNNTGGSSCGSGGGGGGGCGGCGGGN